MTKVTRSKHGLTNPLTQGGLGARYAVLRRRCQRWSGNYQCDLFIYPVFYIRGSSHPPLIGAGSGSLLPLGDMAWSDRSFPDHLQLFKDAV